MGVDELYEYMKEKIARVRSGEEVSIDTAHAFRMFQLVCFMKQIRGIINQEDDMWNALRKTVEGRA
jgi:hypothetical protein